MVQKKTEGKVEIMEKEMDDLRSEMQKPPSLESSVEHLTQNMATMIQSLG